MVRIAWNSLKQVVHPGAEGEGRRSAWYTLFAHAVILHMLITYNYTCAYTLYVYACGELLSLMLWRRQNLYWFA